MCMRGQDCSKDEVPMVWLATEGGSPPRDGCYLFIGTINLGLSNIPSRFPFHFNERPPKLRGASEQRIAYPFIRPSFQNNTEASTPHPIFASIQFLGAICTIASRIDLSVDFFPVAVVCAGVASYSVSELDIEEAELVGVCLAACCWARRAS
jgi:hypothetical protein